jgi:hypothetical protein
MRAASLVLTIALAACGGGGGSEGGGGGGPSPSGLMPPAQPLGAILAQDAATLRILRPGATWIYRGAVLSASSIPVQYTNTVTHAAVGATVSEQSSDLLGEGSDNSTLRLDAGTLRTTVSLAEFGVAQPLDIVLLRSPVQALDRYVHFDQRVSDAVGDLDGDGKREALDLALYSEVKGEETLDLASRRAVRTIRVDTVTLARVRGSAQGVLSDVFRAEQAIWYAPGIGVVRTRADLPSAATPGARDETVEELDYWDGLSQGLGAAPPRPILRAGTQTALRGFPLAAMPLGDGALLLTRIDPADLTRYTLTRLDGSSVSVSSQDVTLDSGAFPGPAAQLIPLGAQARLLYQGAHGGVSVLGIDASGAPTSLNDQLLVPGPLIAPDSGPLFVAASTDNAVWIAWLRQRDPALEGPFSVDLMVAGFGADGTPVAPAVVLLTQKDSRELATLRLAAAGSRVLITWREGFGQAATVTNYVAMDSGGGVLARRQIADDLFLKPVVTAGDSLYLCWVVGHAGPVAAVRLDAAYEPLRATAGSLSNELVSPAWAGSSFSDDSFGCLIDGERVALMGSEAAMRWPWESNFGPLASLIDVQLSTSAPPAAATVSQRIARFELTNFARAATVALPTRMFTFGEGPMGQTALVMSWRP